MLEPYESPVATVIIFSVLEQLAFGDEHRTRTNVAADDGDFDGGVGLESSIF